jgi:Holliday junction resolvasome RuvABC endonuclease subunit
MNKLVFDINKLENVLCCKIARDKTVLGLDTASRSGYCIAEVKGNKLVLSNGFIDIDVSKIKDKTVKNALRYNAVYETLTNLVEKTHVLVIEDVFFSRNVYTAILLARIGAIAYTVGRQHDIRDIRWKTAVSARKLLGLKCNVKKELVHKQFCELTGSNITDIDIVDAVILAICGLIE